MFSSTDALARGRQQFLGRGHTHIAHDQRLFQFLPEFVGDLVFLEDGADAAQDAAARLLQALFELDVIFGLFFLLFTE